MPPARHSRAGRRKPRQATLDEYNLLILTKTKYKTEADSLFSPLQGSLRRWRGAGAGRAGGGPGVPPEGSGRGRAGWRRGCEAGGLRGLPGARRWGHGPGPGAAAMALAGGCSSINTNGRAAALGRGSGDGGPGWGGLGAARQCLADDLPGPAVAHARL